MNSRVIVSGWEYAERWTRTLYNRPVISAIDYFIANLVESSDIIDRESSGHTKHKLKIKVGGNEDDIGNMVAFGPIDIEWAFGIFKARHQEPAGNPISRISKQLNAPGTVIERELGVGGERRRVSGIG